MIQKHFEYIKQEDRDIDGYDYIFENRDGSEWIGMKNGVNSITSFNDAVKALSGEHLLWKKGRYPYKKPVIVNINKSPSKKLTTCVMINISN